MGRVLLQVTRTKIYCLYLFHHSVIEAEESVRTYDQPVDPYWYCHFPARCGVESLQSMTSQPENVLLYGSDCMIEQIWPYMRRRADSHTLLRRRDHAITTSMYGTARLERSTLHCEYLLTQGHALTVMGM